VDENRGLMATDSTISFRNAQTPVRNQGPDRPTCAAFAVTAAHEWMRNDGLDLSEESCLWSAHKLGGPGDGSTSISLGLGGISKDGQATEQHWPYGNPAWPASPPASAADPANRVMPGAFRSLGLPPLADVGEIIRQGEAVILSLRFVPSAWYYVGTDALVDAPPGEIAIKGHAVLAVGVEARPNGDVVEFKNSWGDSWGDHGYGYLANTYWTRYGKTAYALAA
jgi:Papain family cysteine protease